MLRKRAQHRIKRWFAAGTSARSHPPHRPPPFTAASPITLLAPYRGPVLAIKNHVGVPDTTWRDLYEPVIHNYAALVQQLPASESHHHAGPGGLLQHGLEVARHVLELKQGVMLPKAAPPEQQSRVQDIWTYACLTAALLHDLGKPITDLKVSLYDDADAYQGAWTPITGPMPVNTPYRVAFNRQRVYGQHQRIPPLLAPLIIPSQGLEWLTRDIDALSAWLAAIQDAGDGNPVDELVRKADSLSVARNLSGRPTARMPAARTKPLSERLMTGLRYLLSHDILPLNRRGAAAYYDGTYLWLVSKTALDALRTHLVEEGQPGIPSRNDRLMDELQQHNLLLTNGERAVWNCRITLGDWQQQLTCLCLEANQVWPSPDQRPQPMDGQVEVIRSEPADLTNETRGIAANAGTQSTPGTKPNENVAEREKSIGDLPMPYATQTPDSAANNEPANLSSNDSSDPVPGAAPVPAADNHRGNGQVAGIPASADAGERFLAWLKQSIEYQTVPINTAQARIHVLPEGLALVSPGIFRDFDSATWSHAQKRFQKLRLHCKTPKDENIWTCQAKGSRKQALLKVILIPDAAAILGVELPGANAAISLLEP